VGWEIHDQFQSPTVSPKSDVRNSSLFELNFPDSGNVAERHANPKTGGMICPTLIHVATWQVSLTMLAGVTSVVYSGVESSVSFVMNHAAKELTVPAKRGPEIPLFSQISGKVSEAGIELWTRAVPPNRHVA